MSEISLTYEISNEQLVSKIVNEIEYGTTFLIDEYEQTIPVPNMGNKWVSYEYKNKLLNLFIQTEFLGTDFFFDKIITAFFYNIIEFGAVYLKKINFSNIFFNMEKSFTNKDVFTSYPVLGTVFKPYYHQSLNQKILFAKKFIEYGGTLVKEDETYFVPKEVLRTEAKLIQNSISPVGVYVPNITAYISDYDFIKELINLNIRVMLVNFLVTGFNPIAKLKKHFPYVKIWGHRVGYEVLKRYISMDALGTLAILSGIDYLHIGTKVNKRDIENQLKFIKDVKYINPNFLPIFSKLSPSTSKNIISKFGRQSIHLFCGSFRNMETGEFSWTNVDNTFEQLNKFIK